MIGRIISRFARIGGRSLLPRFSLLSVVALALIAATLATVLDHEMSRDALQKQANEVAVVVQGVYLITPIDALLDLARLGGWPVSASSGSRVRNCAVAGS